jgi:hypothetical protein
MSADPNILEQNQKLADQINAEALANPQSPYVGKFVGIANGKVVVVSDNLDDLDDALEKIEPDPDKTFFFEVGVDYSTVDFIWAMLKVQPFQTARANPG